MLGQRINTRWVIQPKEPKDGKYFYLKFDSDEKGSFSEEVEDVFSASTFISKEEAEHERKQLEDSDSLRTTAIFFKETAALFRAKKKD